MLVSMARQKCTTNNPVGRNNRIRTTHLRLCTIHFFRQFCGGETVEECRATMDRLGRAGIQSILDLSVESDESNGTMWKDRYADGITEQTLHSVKTAAGNGAMIAIKLTAFGPPDLLLKMNHFLASLDQMFYQQGGDDDGDRQNQKAMDLIEYRKRFGFYKHQQTRTEGGLALEEWAAYDRMMDRLHKICALAAELNVGVMVDAEQSYFQHAIDHVAINLQQQFNKLDQSPVVFNTYQMYTKSAQKKLELDVERAKRDGFCFAAKIVRGAYMISERSRAKEQGYPSPIHDTLEDTHASYNNGILFLLSKMSDTTPIVLMVATHNRDSIRMTVDAMDQYQIPPSAVHFGQLYGMQDQVSYSLSERGYSIYKYLPYGKIDQVMPYLIRRAQENAAVLAGSSLVQEQRFLLEQLRERWLGITEKDTGRMTLPITTGTG